MPACLEVAEGDLSAAGAAQDHVGQAQTEQRDPLERLLGRRQRTQRQGSSGTRVQEVERYLLRCQLAELGDQLEALCVALAHAEQHAAAQLHVVLLDQLAGVPALVPAVGGDDVVEEGS